MKLTASEFIDKAEGLKQSEINTRRRLEQIRSERQSIQNAIDIQQYRLESLYAELDSLERFSDGETDNSAMIESIMNSISSVQQKIREYQQKDNELKEREDNTSSELHRIEVQEQDTLLDIQDSASRTNQNISLMSTIGGDYGNVATQATNSFQHNLGQLSQAAQILGGNVPLGATNAGGGFSSTKRTDRNSTQSPNLSSRNLYEAANVQRENRMSALGARKNPSLNNLPDNSISKFNSFFLASEDNKDKKSGGLGRLPKKSQNKGSVISALLYKIQNNDSDSIVFGDYVLKKDPMNGSRYYVAMNHFKEFCEFWKNPDKYKLVVEDYYDIVNACDIEGIYLNENERQDPFLFWNRGKDYSQDSEDFFLQVASHIPEVTKRLESGESLESISNDPDLKTCCDFYFASPIQAYIVNGFKYFAGAGRHRLMAAQKLGYNIPIHIIGRYVSRNKDNLGNWSFVSSKITYTENIDAANPNYEQGEEWKINCQRCVPTYEMRSRGYDVTAQPCFDDSDHLSYFPFDVWERPVIINTNGSGMSDIQNKMKEWGDGSRAQIVVIWDNGFGGHTFTAEQINGKTVFVDPQNGDTDVEWYFDEVQDNCTKFCRIDNIQPSSYILNCCERGDVK